MFHIVYMSDLHFINKEMNIEVKNRLFHGTCNCSAAILQGKMT